MAAAASTPEAAPAPPHARRLHIRGGMVLTLDAHSAIYDPGEVVVEDGRIVAVGPRTDLPPVPDEEILDATRSLILPGLVNAHCHSSDALVRGTAPA
ncbi:MAG: amidohydrolase family protein, partial [Armatimonadota bacterium]